MQWQVPLVPVAVRVSVSLFNLVMELLLVFTV